MPVLKNDRALFGRRDEVQFNLFKKHDINSIKY
jgi:hypothetical protein